MPVSHNFFDKEGLAEQGVLDLSTGKKMSDADVSNIKEYYCGWIGSNGIISNSLKARHGTFFKWLDCP